MCSIPCGVAETGDPSLTIGAVSLLFLASGGGGSGGGVLGETGGWFGVLGDDTLKNKLMYIIFNSDKNSNQIKNTEKFGILKKSNN